MTLTRAKFNELTADLVDRTMGPVQMCIRDRLTDDQPLDRVTRARVDAVFASLDHEPEKLAQGAARALAGDRRSSTAPGSG